MSRKKESVVGALDSLLAVMKGMNVMAVAVAKVMGGIVATGSGSGGTEEAAARRPRASASGQIQQQSIEGPNKTKQGQDRAAHSGK